MLNYILYALIVTFVNCYKFLELKLYHLFPHFVKSKILRAYKKAGITIIEQNTNLSLDNSVDDNNNNINSTKNNCLEIKLLKTTINNLSVQDFYLQLAVHGNLGFGETYMAGLWECNDMISLMTQIMESNIIQKYFHTLNRGLNNLLFHVCNLQTKERAWTVADVHYDLGNELYEAMLGPTMNYTCGYWASNPSNLDQAQINKMELIAQKLKLAPGMKILDLGCGWGSLAKYLAQNYNVQVVACTIGKYGADYAVQSCQGLPVDIHLMDYRDLPTNQLFDRITAIGLMEHIGPKNYSSFLSKISSFLKPDGLVLIHTIGVNHTNVVRIEPFFHKYIFPNGVLPTAKDITNEINGKFIIEDWHNFSFDYYKTLVEWKRNFEANWNSGAKLSTIGKYDEQFYKMWNYYLSVAAASFKSRQYQLWQIVLSKNGFKGGYVSVR